MSMIQKFKTTKAFDIGLHIVKLESFGETASTVRTLDNGEVKPIKATIWLKLEDTNGCMDKHVIYLDTIRQADEEGNQEDVINVESAENLNRIVTGIQQQFPKDHAINKTDDLEEILALLKITAATFKVLITEAPKADGTGYWKNYTYNKDLIEVASLKK